MHLLTQFYTLCMLQNVASFSSPDLGNAEVSVNGICYVYVDQEKEHEEAAEYCEVFYTGGTLAALDSAQVTAAAASISKNGKHYA